MSNNRVKYSVRLSEFIRADKQKAVDISLSQQHVDAKTTFGDIQAECANIVKQREGSSTDRVIADALEGKISIYEVELQQGYDALNAYKNSLYEEYAAKGIIKSNKGYAAK